MVSTASPSSVKPVRDTHSTASGTALHGPPRAPLKPLTFTQRIHVVHRILILVAALWYMATSLQSSIAPLHVRNILAWMGTSTIRTSPFVKRLLQNETTPRNYTVYLEADGGWSATGCTTPRFNKRLYSNAFLRLALQSMQRDCAYNFSELVTYEVMLPIVDCSFTPLMRGADTNMRVFFLLRNRRDADDVLLVASRFNMQDYKVPEMIESGPYGLAIKQLIKDMSEPAVFKTVFLGALGYPFEPFRGLVYTAPELNDRGWWVMTALPPNAATAPKQVVTSSRTGFYVGSDGEQANIKNQYWSVDRDPVLARTKWNWHGEPVLKDSWACVHLIHSVFVVDCARSLALLFLVMGRNFQAGKIWVGDAFVSISSSLLLRGVWILGSWTLSGYWSLVEFCVHDAHTLAGTQEIFFHVFREGIDPAYAIAVFETVFSARAIVKSFPRVVATLTEYAIADTNLSILGVSQTVALSSPLRLWTSHKLPPKNLGVIFACLFPLYFALALVMVFVVLRKLYRRLFKRSIAYRQNTTGTQVSDVDDASTTVLYKRSLTLFEISTGAELQTRYGLVSDFKNYLTIKDMKYASADGVYSNGFVVANGKFLVAADDLVPMALQKLLHVRLRNLYAYQVDGSTVQQRAWLVYPHRLSWDDLVHLNVTVLS